MSQRRLFLSLFKLGQFEANYFCFNKCLLVLYFGENWWRAYCLHLYKKLNSDYDTKELGWTKLHQTLQPKNVKARAINILLWHWLKNINFSAWKKTRPFLICFAVYSLHCHCLHCLCTRKYDTIFFIKHDITYGIYKWSFNLLFKYKLFT